MDAIYDECSMEPTMDEKVKAILTQEVIDKALEDRWRGIVPSCIICGRRTM